MEKERLILVAAAVVQLALWLVLAGRYKAPPAAPGAVVLRYGWKLRFLGLCIAFAIPSLFILLLVVSPVPNAPNPLPFGITLLTLGLVTLGLVGGALLVDTQGAYVVVTPLGVAGISPWRGRREWTWEQVERVEYSIVNQWLLIYGPGKDVIRASRLLVGIGALAQMIMSNVPGHKYASARKVLERLKLPL